MTASTSRIIVKGLPKWTTDKRLKSLFEPAGEVTDVRLMCTRDGMFRRFAFVGFTDESSAKVAVGRFNGTFVDTARIEVQLAYPRDSVELSRPWSKYSSGSSLHAAYLDRVTTPVTKDSKVKPDNFTQKGTTDKTRHVESLRDERKRKMLASICDSDDEEKPQKMSKLTQGGSRTRDIPVWADDLPVCPIEDDTGISSDSSDGYQDIEKQVDHAAHNSLEEVNTGNEDSAEHDPISTESMVSEQIMDTGRLFVRNLAYGCTDEDIRRLFEPFGELVDVHLSISRETKRCKGFAHVLFLLPEHALQAYGSLDGTAFQGRLLHILPGQEKPESASTTNTSFKKQKEKSDKAESQRGHNWNTLFVRSDTVMDAVAARLGVDKVELLAPDRNSDGLLASRVAVAEAALVQETKAALESEGIVLDAFEGRPAARSNTVILVKNLPYTSDSTALRALFEKFGLLARFVMPPTNAVAIVEFLESGEARKAFASLAYTRFRDVPLYLEWAPVGSVKPPNRSAKSGTADPAGLTAAITNDTTRGTLEKTVDATEQRDTVISAGTHTLYVKNVSFATSDDELLRVFSDAGKVLSARIARKRGGLSMGFAFVEYGDSDSLSRAIDTLQGRVVDGHSLQISKSQASHKQRPAENERADTTQENDDGKSTKLIVRNIPFEANEKEVRALFKAFAQVRRVRLPQRFDGRHRGFGFVDFATHSEAAHAKSVLSSTHLYGRHLVIEWASADDVVEAEQISRQRSDAITSAAPGTKAKSVAESLRTLTERDAGDSE